MTATSTTSLRAFHGDVALKQNLLAEIRKHERADAIVKGTYGKAALPVSAFKGCAIGCALHALNGIRGQIAPTSDHARFPAELGIPIELAYHIDAVFEGLPTTLSRTWPRRVIEAIPIGADLSSVMPALLRWMILDPTAGLIAQAAPAFHPAYRQLAALVAKDWDQPKSVTPASWVACGRELADCSVWARAWAGSWAWARAESWAGSGARAGSWAWARAGVMAWAGAWAGASRLWETLSTETLRCIQHTRGIEKVEKV